MFSSSAIGEIAKASKNCMECGPYIAIWLDGEWCETTSKPHGRRGGDAVIEWADTYIAQPSSQKMIREIIKAARSEKDQCREAAVALGRRGGLAAAGKGIRALNSRLTPEQRSASAKRAAAKRWGVVG